MNLKCLKLLLSSHQFSSQSSELCFLTTVNAVEGPVPQYCLHCICIVESGCKMTNPVCHMDVGSLSCGPYQIKEAYWKDARLKGGDLMGGTDKPSVVLEGS